MSRHANRLPKCALINELAATHRFFVLARCSYPVDGTFCEEYPKKGTSYALCMSNGGLKISTIFTSNVKIDLNWS